MFLSIETSDDILKDSDDKVETENKESNEGMYL